MNVVVFGASGMVGKGVLLECLDDADVERVLVIGRTKAGIAHPKLEELSLADFTDYGPLRGKLSGLDACFFCLGVSSVGMSEADYTRVTLDFTMAAANALIQESPGMTFIYVTGEGTDETAKGRIMWARVKGETENRLLAMPFEAAYLFRPGIIEPKRGALPKERWVRAAYGALGFLFPVFHALAPNSVTTSERVGRAMLKLAKTGSTQKYFRNRDINALGAP